MKRIPLRGGAEYDVFSCWRKLMCYTRRAGISASIKRQYRRRFRREANKCDA